MALITRTDARARANRDELRKAVLLREDASDTLMKSASASTDATFDIFLCHAYLDAEEIKGIYLMLLDAGMSVYVDWIVDKDLNRQAVTATNASRLRSRINHSTALLYATSFAAQQSKWMPWELGYADGLGRRVAIAPLADSTGSGDAFDGREYLALYPYVSGPAPLFIHRTAQKYARLTTWLAGVDV